MGERGGGGGARPPLVCTRGHATSSRGGGQACEGGGGEMGEILPRTCTLEPATSSTRRPAAKKANVGV